MTSVSLLKGPDSALSAVPILGFMPKKGQDLVDWRHLTDDSMRRSQSNDRLFDRNAILFG